MYNLLMFSKDEVVYLEKIKALDVVKALKLFSSRNYNFDFRLYEYSSFADDDDKYFEILHFYR